ncbi:triphosphoribosyl-dephospho-CoA synthase MdcB, partial [Burkholderia contaminans]
GGPAASGSARAPGGALVGRGGGRGRDWRLRAAAAHRAFVARRLSPGGAADLLAMSVFVDALDVDEGVR